MFNPLNPTNAVQEAVFVFALARPLDRRAIEDIIKIHEEKKSSWLKDLPKLQHHQVIQFSLGQPTPSASAPLAPISFESYQKDGSLERRLFLDGNTIALNIINYEGWEEATPWVKRVFNGLLPILSSNKYSFSGMGLQYVNAFNWEGSIKDYAIDKLLARDSEFIPKSIWAHNSSPSWHLHQGAVYDVKTSIPGNMLERSHLDAAVEGRNAVVRLDVVLQVTAFQPFPASSTPFTDEKRGRVWSLFDELHALTKGRIKDYLRTDICDRIGIGDPE